MEMTAQPDTSEDLLQQTTEHGEGLFFSSHL